MIDYAACWKEAKLLAEAQAYQCLPTRHCKEWREMYRREFIYQLGIMLGVK